MAELQGAKVAVNDAKTGHVIEFELVRVGTLREFRELLKAHEELTAKNAQLEEASRAVASAVKGVAEARDTAFACVDEITRQRDEAKAALAEMTRQRDTGFATVGDLQEALEKETKKCEETQGAAEIDEAAAMGRQDRIADLLAQLDEAKRELQTNVEQIIGAFGDLG